jgi:glycosyltransferase involved in cell wall biosynthesis
MDKIKILVLSDYAFVKGGAEKVSIISAIGLASRGHEVVFFSAVGPVDKSLKDSKIKEIICLGQYDILDNPNKLQAMISGINNNAANKNLKKLFERWKPDIVHIHGVSKALSWSVFNTIYSYKVPIIYTLHDYGLVCPNLGIYNFRREEVCRYYQPGYGLKCLLTNCDKRNYFQKLWRWFRYKWTISFYKIDKKVSGYIVVSEFLKDVIQKNYRTSRRIEVIYNPIEGFDQIPDYAETDFYKNPKKPKFLFIGRLSAEKGIDLLLRAIKDVDANLTIIGDGELRSFCEQSASSLGHDKVKVLGYQGKERIKYEMKTSLALILPSKCMEPAPLVLQEAASNSLPSIVANHGGMVEFVKDGVSGLYFNAGDPESLKSVLCMLIKDPGFCKKLGENARQVMLENKFDINSHLDNLEKFYYEILYKSSR